MKAPENCFICFKKLFYKEFGKFPNCSYQSTCYDDNKQQNYHLLINTYDNKEVEVIEVYIDIFCLHIDVVNKLCIIYVRVNNNVPGEFVYKIYHKLPFPSSEEYINKNISYINKLIELKTFL